MTEIGTAKLREIARAATPGPWYPPHFGDETTICECKSIVDDGWAGGIASIHVGNGLPVSYGGNDAPPPDEAAANGRFIAAANPSTVLAMCDEIDRLRALLRRAGEALNARDYHESNAAWRDIARSVSREIEEAIGHE